MTATSRLLIPMTVLLVSACATQGPVKSLPEARVAVRALDGHEIGTYAAADRRTARRMLAAAEHAARRKDTARAGRLAQQARVEAELAHAKTAAGRAKAAADQLAMRLADLQQELKWRRPIPLKPLSPDTNTGHDR